MLRENDTATVAKVSKSLAAAGCSVIPVRPNGTKKPALRLWRPYMEQRPDDALLDRWFGGEYRFKGPEPEAEVETEFGLALITGAVSGGIELTEIEGRVLDARPTFLDDLDVAMSDNGLGELMRRLTNGWVERSPSGGLHWVYRLIDGPVPGNTKVAGEPGKLIANGNGRRMMDVLAETRGEGGFVVVYPTPGHMHPSGRPWERVSGGPETAAGLTLDEREAFHAVLHDLLDTWDAHKAAEQERAGIDPNARRTTADERSQVYGEGESPADHYNRVADWADLLVPLGWTLHHELPSGERHWTRPGKGHADGTSATTRTGGLGNNIYVFSESVGLPTHEPMSPTAFRAFYETDGRFGEMVGKLRREGYGAPMERKTSPSSFSLDELEGLGGLEKSEGEDGHGVVAETSSPKGRAELGKTGQSRMAHRFAEVAAGRFLHTHETGWLYWTGTHWAEDKGQKRVRRAFRKMLDAAWREAIDDPKGLGKDVRLCHSANGEKGALDVAATIAALSCDVDDLDPYPDLWNCANGVVDLQSGELMPHDPKYRMTVVSRAAYDPEAKGPNWQQFLEKSLPDEAVRGFIQRYAGQALRGRDKEQKLVIMTGTGSNGKSVFVEAMKFALGDYAMVGRPEMLLASRPGSFDGSERLRGVRWATFSEIEKGQELGVAMVKRLTGTETITASVKHKPDISFRPSHSLVLVVNDLPHIPDTGHAIWRRVLVVPWSVTIAEHEQDDQLGRKLEAEADAVFTWAVQGLMEYKRRGLDEPEVVTLATQKYQAESDDLSRFLVECTVRLGGQKMTSTELYDLYGDWCNLERIMSKLGPRAFSQELKTRGRTMNPPLKQDSRRQWNDIAKRPNWQSLED